MAKQSSTRRVAPGGQHMRSSDLAQNGTGQIKSTARRARIERLVQRTTKDKGLSPEAVAALHDDAWGKRPDS
jgi:hypothetical protein